MEKRRELRISYTYLNPDDALRLECEINILDGKHESKYPESDSANTGLVCVW